MGGSALLIYGSVGDELLQPRPAPRSVMDRLIGRQRTSGPAWSQIGPTRRMIDLPTTPLDGLASAFGDYVVNRASPPWAATASVLEYLRLDVVSTYLRGEDPGDNSPEWYLQFTLSGCGGMAEVSAELMVHWADRWYRENQSDLQSRYLTPYGFKPDGRIECASSTALFVPFGIAGYAIFNPEPRPPDNEYTESRYFEIDVAAMDTLTESERSTVLRKLDEDIPPILPADSCCCQLCAPQFDVAACDRLVPFK
jgi:hypothetical protein